jgi:cytoskeleton protein RodZ
VATLPSPEAEPEPEVAAVPVEQDKTEPGKKSPGRQPPWEKNPEVESGSFGTWLRRQREIREISLREVAERTKISLRYLEAMEEDRFDVLPAPVFAKGFLREYARYVGLSADDVVNHYLAVHRPETGEASRQEGRRGGRNQSWVYGIVLFAAALLLLGLVGVLAFSAERGRKPASRLTPPMAPPSPAAPVNPATSTAPSPLATSAPAPPPAPSSPLELTLDFTQECWVEAKVDGKKALSETRVQGESLQIPAQQSILLTLGNAGAVEAQLNGRPLSLGKKAGEVLHDFEIDLDTLKALQEKPQEAPSTAQSGT